MYEFITDNSVSKMAESLRRRYSQDGLFGVILDVVMLSECDYIVCTFSSQVCGIILWCSCMCFLLLVCVLSVCTCMCVRVCVCVCGCVGVCVGVCL